MTDHYVWPCYTRTGVYGRIYLSLDRARELLREVVSEHPMNVTLIKAYYDFDGRPVDPIAVLLEKIGFHDPGLLQPNGDARVWRSLHEEVLLGDLGTKAFLTKVQEWTDRGKTWEKALEIAERWMDTHPSAYQWHSEESRVKEETIRNAMIARGEARVA